MFPCRFRPIASLASLLIALSCLPSIAQMAARKPEVVIEIKLLVKPAGAVTFSLEPLDGPGGALNVVVETGASARTRVPAGRYRLTTPKPVVSAGQAFSWDLEIPAVDAVNEVTLSPANVLSVVAVDQEPQPVPAEARPDEVKLRVRLAPELRSQEPAESRLAVSVRRADASGESRGLFFSSDGQAEVALAPGRYQVTGTGAAPGGSSYLWELEVPATEPVNELELSTSNATVIAATHQVAAAPEAPPSAPAGAVRPSVATATTIPARDEREIQELLTRWADATRNGDMEALMSCYAPRLHTYFQKQNVSWNDVRRDKQAFFRTYSKSRDLQVRDVRFERNERGLEATLHKAWAFDGSRTFRGEVVSRLTFEKYAGEWRIAAERERLVWEQKSPATPRLTRSSATP